MLSCLTCLLNNRSASRRYCFFYGTAEILNVVDTGVHELATQGANPNDIHEQPRAAKNDSHSKELLQTSLQKQGSRIPYMRAQRLTNEGIAADILTQTRFKDAIHESSKAHK